MCGVCAARLKPETGGGRSEGAEVQWAKLEFSNGLNAERSCRFFVPAQLRFRLIGSRRGKRAKGKANLNRRRDADCTTVPALFQRGEASLHSEMEREILRFGPKIRCSGEGKLLTPIFLFPRKELFSLLSRIFSADIKVHFSFPHFLPSPPSFLRSSLRRWAENGDRMCGRFHPT